VTIHQSQTGPGSGHAKSTMHKNYKTILALLKDPSIRHMKIANMFGVTRERVRQIAVLVGERTGREREMDYKAIRVKKAWEKRKAEISNFPIMVALKRRVTSLGYSFEILKRNKVKINGYNCLVKHAFYDIAPYVRFAWPTITQQEANDFFLYWWTEQDRWIVFPQVRVSGISIREGEKTATSFLPHEPATNRRGAKNIANHDYRDYLDRLDFLGERKS
jgi:hypothetical protein